MSHILGKPGSTLPRLWVAAAVFGGVMLAGAARAQSTDSTTFIVKAAVEKRCELGAPSSDHLALGDLTGPDGRLDPAKTGGAIIAAVTIDNAWCNTASNLSVQSDPMSLGAAAPDYASPAGFSRYITYDARLRGWPEAVEHRAVRGDNTARSATFDGPNTGQLTLEISSLGTLNAVGDGEASGLVVEAGIYSGAVIVTLGATP